VAELSIPHGSIAIDGVSLTISERPGPDTVQIGLIPYTMEHTTLGRRRVGDRVQIEADMLGKYVRQLVRRA
jgi:riboflavin synthase